MSVAKVTEIIASSPESFDDAVNEGIKRAGKTLENVRSAWVKDLKVVIEKGEITEYRVTMKVSFILKDWFDLWLKTEPRRHRSFWSEKDHFQAKKYYWVNMKAELEIMQWHEKFNELRDCSRVDLARRQQQQN